MLPEHWFCDRTGETGGLIGYHSGSVSYYGEYYVAVRNSCNEGTVTGTGACTGGLIGNSWSGTKVTDCYNAGKLSGTDYVGGLAGDANETHFDYCYNTGSVSGRQNVGGLAGRIRSGHIYHSYSIGDVTGTDSETTGSLCGERGGSVVGTVQYSYALKRRCSARRALAWTTMRKTRIRSTSTMSFRWMNCVRFRSI